MKSKAIYASVLSILTCLAYISVEAQDMALDRFCAISPSPYSFQQTIRNVHGVLTDGRYSSQAYFWSQSSTLTWVKVPKISVTIDLQRTSIIKTVFFNTVRCVDSTFDVRYPSHIYVFISQDDKTFEYVGDASIGKSEIANLNQIHTFALPNINQRGRYVCLQIIPDGFITSCDEIEVQKGNDISSRSLPDTILKDDLNKTVDALLTKNFDRNNLLIASNRFVQRQNMNSLVLLNSIKDRLNDPEVNFTTLQTIRSKLIDFHLNNLRSFYKDRFIINVCTPWDSISPFYMPHPSPQHAHYQFTIPVGGEQYGAFTLTNCNIREETLTLSLESKEDSVVGFHFYKADFVQSKDYTSVPDAMIPILNNNIRLSAGETGLIIFKISGLRQGVADSYLTVTDSDKIKTLGIGVNVVALSGFNNFKLNTNVWAYLNHPMVLGREAAAIRNLKDHHINTLVVGPGFLSPINKPSFLELNVFLKKFLFVNKILISTAYSVKNIREPDTSAPFLSEKWKKEFVKWYSMLLAIVAKSGFDPSQVYFYPYDEVRGAKDITDFINFATWAKDSVPGVHLYATISPPLVSNTTSLNRLFQILPICQISLKPGYLMQLPNLPPKHGQIWVYQNDGISRSLSPYAHYRLMAWKAYFEDVSGIGFWSFAGDSRIKKASSPFLNIDMDYGVIYDGNDMDIISSRRWEAFGLGVEDYQILYLYGKKFGIEKAKAVVSQVIRNPTNYVLANILRTQMINDLQKL